MTIYSFIKSHSLLWVLSNDDNDNDGGTIFNCRSFRFCKCRKLLQRIVKKICVSTISIVVAYFLILEFMESESTTTIPKALIEQCVERSPDIMHGFNSMTFIEFSFDLIVMNMIGFSFFLIFHTETRDWSFCWSHNRYFNYASQIRELFFPLSSFRRKHELIKTTKNSRTSNVLSEASPPHSPPMLDRMLPKW